MALFDNEAFYSATNEKKFSGEGLYINWLQNRFSLGENITFDDGDAALRNISAQALKLSTGQIQTEHTGTGSVTTIDGATRQREAFATFEMPGSGSSGTIISVPVGPLKSIAFRIETTAGKSGANALRILNGTLRTDSSGGMGITYTDQLSTDIHSGWGSNRPTISAGVVSGSFSVSHGNPDSADVTGTTKLTLWVSDLPPGAGSPPTPSAPTITNVCASGTGLRVTWDQPLGTDSYQLERGPSGSGPWTVLANTTDNTFTDALPFFDPDTTYFYRVKGIYNGGETSYSSNASASYNGASSC
jgi:hypothetical protein